MINVNDLKNGLTIKYDNNIFSVIEFQHVKPGKGSAFVRTKLKNLRTGAVIDKTFNTGIKVERAQINKEKMQYLYSDGDNFVFMNTSSYEQFELNISKIKYEKNFIKEGNEVDLIFYEKELIGINLPDKVELKIIKTEPAVKGNTTSNALKKAILETGYSVMVPLFISEGEIIIVSTESGKYTSRK